MTKEICENREKLKKLLKKMNHLSCEIHKYKKDFDELIEEIYGFHYSDVDKDNIIDCVDYGLGKMSFKEFDKLMKEGSKK